MLIRNHTTNKDMFKVSNKNNKKGANLAELTIKSHKKQLKKER